MARVKEIKSAQKPQGRCTHPGCETVIQPGMPYRYVKFRYGGKRIKCGEHTFRPSELTQSKAGILYEAQETAHDEIEGAESVEDLESILSDCSSAAEDVRSEYEEAAEHFGGQGENQERAELVEAWISELEQVAFDDFEGDDPDEDQPCEHCNGGGECDITELSEEEAGPDDPCSECGATKNAPQCGNCGGDGTVERETDDQDALETAREEWLEEQRDKAREAVDALEL